VLCPHWDAGAGFGEMPVSQNVVNAMFRNKSIVEQNAKRLFAANAVGTSLKPRWHRAFEASEAVMGSHNDMLNPVFLNFMRQLYVDVSLSR